MNQISDEKTTKDINGIEVCIGDTVSSIDGTSTGIVRRIGVIVHSGMPGCIWSEFSRPYDPTRNAPTGQSGCLQYLSRFKLVKKENNEWDI